MIKKKYIKPTIVKEEIDLQMLCTSVNGINSSGTDSDNLKYGDGSSKREKPLERRMVSAKQ